MNFFIVAVILNIVGAREVPNVPLKDLVDNLLEHRKLYEGGVEFLNHYGDPEVLIPQQVNGDKENSNSLFDDLPGDGFPYNANKYPRMISYVQKTPRRLHHKINLSSLRRSLEPVIIIITKNKFSKNKMNNKERDSAKPPFDYFDGDENNAAEVVEPSPTPTENDYRRKSKVKLPKDSVESSSSDESEFEGNPGNPYTVFKNKYRQNWIWNHFMDGDHMNVNPNAPTFNSPGPSGAQLFFGRKWWYFNQDDYKPMG